MHIICIDVTNKCDLGCSNCTRLLGQQTQLWEMTPENFRLSLQSLKGYWGVVAMIGGNPCMHSQFPELCRIFKEEFPEPLQRGLWTNNPFKHEELCIETFGTFNLNAHGEERAQAPLIRMTEAAREKQGIAWTYLGHSVHAPLLTAIRDLYAEEEMWEKISQCDINREWSASIVQNAQGQLRAYFCEVAASFDLARGTDNGIEVYPGWWTRTANDFRDQIGHFCPGCGVAAKLKGRADSDETDDYTRSNAGIAKNNPKRKVERVTHPNFEVRRVTDYGQIVT
jgi:hypothetical protein